ncbi:MAG: hypothetical protein AB1352_04490 [Patescibacteria group bacterium]
MLQYIPTLIKRNVSLIKNKKWYNYLMCKIATQVLKDGDMVELNANHGWVRKIS